MKVVADNIQARVSCRNLEFDSIEVQACYLQNNQQVRQKEWLKPKGEFSFDKLLSQKVGSSGKLEEFWAKNKAVKESQTELAKDLNNLFQQIKIAILTRFLALLADEKENQEMLLSKAPGFKGKPNCKSKSELQSLEVKRVQYQSKQWSFDGSGMVELADGQTINFDLRAQMSTSSSIIDKYKAKADQNGFQFSQEHIERVAFSSFSGKLVDPLVLCKGNVGPSFGENTMQFDLNGDSKLEDLPCMHYGSGFLVWDKNKNGIVDDGRELFGPESGWGFQELSELDEDANGWIDSGDAIFAELSLWENADGSQDKLKDLKYYDVGAINTQSWMNGMSMLSQNFTHLGTARESSFYLKNSGDIGMTHELLFRET